MKKTYIKPAMKTVKVYGGRLLTGASGIELNRTMGQNAKAYSRESSMWDDEDEEIENSMWK